MGYPSDMTGDGRDFAVNVAFSLALHFFVFAAAFLTPSLQAQRFQMPVAYEVKLVELPGGRRVAQARGSSVVLPPKSVVSPPVEPSKAQAPSSAPEELTLPGKRTATRQQPRSEPSPSSTSPRPALREGALPAGTPENGGGLGVVAESSVSTDKADPSLSYYLAAIQAKVSSRWVEPALNLQSGQAERVTVSFTVLRSGLVRDIQILHPSQNVFLDRSALRAVQEAVPLPPFPPLFSEETLLVRFHFEMRGQ